MGRLFAPVVMVSHASGCGCAREKREDLDWTLIFLLSFRFRHHTLGIVVIASPVDRYLMPIYPLLLILEILLDTGSICGSDNGQNPVGFAHKQEKHRKQESL